MDKGLDHAVPFVSQAPTQADEKDPKYCIYHSRKGHTLDQCVMFRRIFDKKLQYGEIILQNEARNMHEQPFPTITTARQEMMVSASVDVPMQHEDEPDLAKMTQ